MESINLDFLGIVFLNLYNWIIQLISKINKVTSIPEGNQFSNQISEIQITFIDQRNNQINEKHPNHIELKIFYNYDDKYIHF